MEKHIPPVIKTTVQRIMTLSNDHYKFIDTTTPLALLPHINMRCNVAVNDLFIYSIYILIFRARWKKIYNIWSYYTHIGI
jgi:hypothetical protein